MKHLRELPCYVPDWYQLISDSLMAWDEEIAFDAIAEKIDGIWDLHSASAEEVLSLLDNIRRDSSDDNAALIMVLLK